MSDDKRYFQDIKPATITRVKPGARGYRGLAAGYKMLSGKGVIILAADMSVLNEVATALRYGKPVELDRALCQDSTMAMSMDIEVAVEQEDDDEL